MLTLVLHFTCVKKLLDVNGDFLWKTVLKELDKNWNVNFIEDLGNLVLWNVSRRKIQNHF